MARREYPGVYPYPAAGGRTLYRALYNDSNGRQRQKRGFSSPSAAAKFRARMQVRAESGELRITRETFAEHFDAWLKGHHRASKGTRDGYRAAGERRLKPFFGLMRLSAIDVQIVRDFAAEMVELVEAGELAPKTVNNTLSCVSTCLKDAVALHKIPSNPCEHIAHLPESHIERDWLRRSEIPPYLAACSDLYRPVAELLIATGVRISEALALRWDDIDFDRRVIRVYRQRTTGGDDHTKSRRFRSVSVGERLLRILRDHYARQSELYACDLTHHHVFVMPVRMRRHDHGRWQSSTPGEPMDRTTVSRYGYGVGVVQHPTLSLEDDAAVTRRVVDAQDGPVVLVGHSYGGAVITEAGNDPNVAALVYIAAFAPDTGESVNTLIQGFPQDGPQPPILPPQDGFLFLDREKFHDSFAADVDADLAAFMADSQVGWGVDALGGAISEAAWRNKPSWYLVSTDDRMIPPSAQREMSARASATVEEVAASHSLYVSQPEAVASVIKTAASAV